MKCSWLDLGKPVFFSTRRKHASLRRYDAKKLMSTPITKCQKLFWKNAIAIEAIIMPADMPPNFSSVFACIAATTHPCAFVFASWSTSLMALCLLSDRDRKKPRGPSLPHHRTYGSRIRRFDELNSYRGARLGSPMVSKKRNGSANANAGVFDNRHGSCADLLVFHASRTDTPRLRSSR